MILPVPVRWRRRQERLRRRFFDTPTSNHGIHLLLQPFQLIIRHVSEYVRLLDNRHRDRIRLSVQAKYLAPLLDAPANTLQEPRIAGLAALPYLGLIPRPAAVLGA